MRFTNPDPDHEEKGRTWFDCFSYRSWRECLTSTYQIHFHWNLFALRFLKITTQFFHSVGSLERENATFCFPVCSHTHKHGWPSFSFVSVSQQNGIVSPGLVHRFTRNNQSLLLFSSSKFIWFCILIGCVSLHVFCRYFVHKAQESSVCSCSWLNVIMWNVSLLTQSSPDVQCAYQNIRYTVWPTVHHQKIQALLLSKNYDSLWHWVLWS